MLTHYACQKIVRDLGLDSVVLAAPPRRLIAVLAFNDDTQFCHSFTSDQLEDGLLELLRLAIPTAGPGCPCYAEMEDGHREFEQFLDDADPDTSCRLNGMCVRYRTPQVKKLKRGETAPWQYLSDCFLFFLPGYPFVVEDHRPTLRTNLEIIKKALNDRLGALTIRQRADQLMLTQLTVARYHVNADIETLSK